MMTQDTLAAAVPGYTSESLNAMTIAQIKALAEDLGYSITATKKADIIAEFLVQQGGETE